MIILFINFSILAIENELLKIESFSLAKFKAIIAGYPKESDSFSSNSKKSPPCAHNTDIGLPLVCFTAYIKLNLKMSFNMN